MNKRTKLYHNTLHIFHSIETNARPFDGRKRQDKGEAGADVRDDKAVGGNIEAVAEKLLEVAYAD